MREGRPAAETAQPRQRADKWLWFARLARTRALAARLVGSGHVRLNGRRFDDPGRGLRVGDVLTVALQRDVRVLRVAAFAERRGPASQALALYEELTSGATPDASASDCGDGDLAERGGSG